MARSAALQRTLSLFFSVLTFTNVWADISPYDDERPQCNCKYGQNIGTRVVGGHNAGRGQFPYASALLNSKLFPVYRTRSNFPMRPYCGATLITDRHVVTAAHCVRERKASDIVLDISDYNLKNGSPNQTRTIREATRLIIHPEHQKEGFLNDIAVIEFQSPLSPQSGIQAAWIAAPDLELMPHSTVTVFGWGRLSFHGHTPDILQTLDLPVIDHDHCQKAFVTKIREDMMLCAGGTVGYDACIGDSGSGLMTKLDEKNVLVGVVSFGKQCALPDTPGIYTKVSRFSDWIYSQTLSSACKPCIAFPEKNQ